MPVESHPKTSIAMMGCTENLNPHSDDGPLWIGSALVFELFTKLGLVSLFGTISDYSRLIKLSDVVVSSHEFNSF